MELKIRPRFSPVGEPGVNFVRRDPVRDNLIYYQWSVLQ